MKRSISSASFILQLIEVVPELRVVYDEHIADYDELLEHVFMADVTRFAECLFAQKSHSDTLSRLIMFIDKAYSSDDEELKELISVSFLENISKKDKTYLEFISLLSPELKLELSKYD
ncbi:hypothetical protein D8T32_14895 [Vibrio vulnificus]|uniref:DUF7674 family protein n=1 Tax=Vibrio vulnificus TaxID=672 RepID=UPI00102894E1|nr:hypothetical protein [Vibrio vulnificus]EGR0752212.1 hypothetical protein [Vibrio vulnificus]RZP88031.1 hypothetical protein D8T54_20925 [Vibrio vulnificus]